MVSPSSEALAGAYAKTQHSLAERAANIVIAQWNQVMRDGDGKPHASREHANLWLSKSVPVIERARRQAAQLGQGFYQANRRLEIPNAKSLTLPRLPEMNREQVTSSLWVVGPREYVDMGKAVDDIFDEETINRIVGAADRHVQNGGREAIEGAYERDPEAVGYYRIEDGDPCFFCAMLMSRGVVYKEDSFDSSDPRFFGPGEAKVHDHCGGSLAPSYDRTVQYPPSAKPHWDLWQELTGKDRNGKPIDPATEFRQRYEGRY